MGRVEYTGKMAFFSPLLTVPTRLQPICDMLHETPAMDPLVAAYSLKLNISGWKDYDGWPACAWISAACFEMLRVETGMFSQRKNLACVDRARQLHLVMRELPRRLLPAMIMTHRSDALLGFPIAHRGRPTKSQDYRDVALLDKEGELGIWLPYVFLEGQLVMHRTPSKIKPQDQQAAVGCWTRIWEKTPEMVCSVDSTWKFLGKNMDRDLMWRYLSAMPINAQPAMWVRMHLEHPLRENSWWSEGFEHWMDQSPTSWPSSLFAAALDHMDKHLPPDFVGECQQVHAAAQAKFQSRALRETTPPITHNRPGSRL